MDRVLVWFLLFETFVMTFSSIAAFIATLAVGWPFIIPAILSGILAVAFGWLAVDELAR